MPSCKKLESVIDSIAPKKEEFYLSGEKTFWNKNNTNYCCTLTEEVIYNYTKDLNLESKFIYKVSSQQPFQQFDTLFYLKNGSEISGKWGANGTKFIFGNINTNGYLSGSNKEEKINYKITSNNISGILYYDSTFSGGISESFDIYGRGINSKFALAINSYLSNKSYPLTREIIKDIWEVNSQYNDDGCINFTVTEFVSKRILKKQNLNTDWQFVSFIPTTSDNKTYNSQVYYRDENTITKSVYDEPTPNITSYKVKINKIDSIVNLKRSHSIDNFNWQTIYNRTERYIDNLQIDINDKVVSYDLYDERGIKICSRQFTYSKK